jgi:alkanesulfonate monooxygenase SsuD/methylene tetrahydromethanopterin reductase-like flavin-dependent oxidoreductase (luciferase family)
LRGLTGRVHVHGKFYSPGANPVFAAPCTKPHPPITWLASVAQRLKWRRSKGFTHCSHRLLRP